MKDLNLSLLIRYGYTGLIVFVMLLMKDPARMKSYVEGAGAVLAPFVVLAIGACVYVLYRYLLGEWIFYPLAHFWDWLFSRANRGQKALSPFWYIRHRHGIPKRQCRDAYNAIRRELVPDPLKKQLDIAHAELYVLYITALMLPFAATIRPNLVPWQYIVGGAVIVQIGAWVADVRQHRYELRSIVSAQTSEALAEFLRKRGYASQQSPSG